VQYGVTIEDIRKWNYLRGYTAQIGRNLKIINPKKDLNAITQTSDSINNVYSEQSSSKLKTTTKTVISTPIEKPLVLDSIVTIYHTVQRNESIGLIAAKYDVLPEDIKKWNNLSTNWIGVSQKLKILINVKLIQPELTKEVLTKQAPEKVVPKKKYYSVKPGDLFNRIADKNGISPEKLRELNPKINPNSIRVGELIRVK
jgi:LysM repeat protein